MLMLEKKSFTEPDEVREPMEKLRSEWVHLMGQTLRRVTCEPGWSWKKHAVPAGEPELCPRFHVKLFFSGVFAVRYENGSEAEFRAGDIGILQPHHDAWVLGDEAVVFIDLAEILAGR